MKNILVIGSTTVDVTLRMDHLPVPEEDIQPYSQSMSVGGCAHNVAHMLSCFKIPHVLYSPIGSGFYGKLVKQAFAEEGRTVLLESPEENGVCYCLIDAMGNRTFMALHGAEYRFKEEWLKECPIEEQDLIYVCGLEIEESSGSLLLEHLARAGQGSIVFAPGPRIFKIQKDRLEKMLDLSVRLHMNVREARILLRRINIDPAAMNIMELAQALQNRTKEMVVLTDGANGSVLCTDKTCVFEPSIKIKQVDGNGAGDAHCGAVLAGLFMEDELRQILKRANLVGAMVAASEGATIASEEFEKRMEEWRSV